MTKNIIRFSGLFLFLLAIFIEFMKYLHGANDAPFSQGTDAGIFGEVSLLHNLIFIVTGLVAMYMARTNSGAKKFALIFSAFYGLLAILGFTMGSPILGILNTNNTFDWIHLIIAIVFLSSSLIGKRDTPTLNTPAFTGQ